MSTSALMSLGTRAMAANYAALQATGNNIANANTAGYSRQSAQLETAGGQFSGAGFFGKGVKVTTVARAHDEFLTREAATTRSLAASDAARSTQLKQLEQVFGTGENGLGYAAGEMFNAWVDVANKPQDTSGRQVVLARAGEMASRFRSAAEQVDALQSGVAQELKVGVASINSLTRQIAALNQKIVAAQGSGHAPNDLLDQRDSAIGELSDYLQLSVIAADDGSTSVFTASGQKLVLGAQTATLVTSADSFDPQKLQLALSESGSTRPLADDALVGGSVAGLLRFQNEDLADARNLVGQMASAIAGSVNQQQALGLDLGHPPGAGVPLLSIGAPAVMGASGNAKVGGVPVASYLDANGMRVPSVGVTVVDSSQLQASDYELAAEAGLPVGSYRLTRLSDGDSRVVSSGDSVDGFRIDVVIPEPVPGDRFRLQTVGNAARDMARALDDPKGLAAAAPVNATLNAANTGSATVASLRATSSALNPDLTATITFTDDSGGYAWTLVDSSGTLPPTSGTGTWAPGEPIALNDWSMALKGVPKSGDALTVQRTTPSDADNGNAVAMMALRDERIVGRHTLADGSVMPGDSVTDAYANVLADVGVRVQTAGAAADQSAALAGQAQAAADSKSGVNLDEEAARLIQFQQSYQAAAKMLQVAQSVFDTLLQTVGG